MIAQIIIISEFPILHLTGRPQPRLHQPEYPPFCAWWGGPWQQRCGGRPEGSCGRRRRWKEYTEKNTQSNENPGASSHNQNLNNGCWAQQINPETINSFVTNMLQSFGLDLSSNCSDTKDSTSNQENSKEGQCHSDPQEQQANSENDDNTHANTATFQDSANNFDTDSKQTPDQDSSADTNIQQAVAQMIAMGFDDQGGWLTRLLEIKKGNISRALESIYPNRSKDSGL